MSDDSIKAERFLYHYTSRETAMEKILPSGQLRFGTISSTNDPRESKNWSFHIYIRKGSVEDTREMYKEVAGEINDLIINRCKVLCLTRDDPSAY